MAGKGACFLISGKDFGYPIEGVGGMWGRGAGGNGVGLTIIVGFGGIWGRGVGATGGGCGGVLSGGGMGFGTATPSYLTSA